MRLKSKKIINKRQNPKTIYPSPPPLIIHQKTHDLPTLIYKSISNIFELKVGDMISDSVYGAGIIVDIYKSENELFFDVNFINAGRMTFSPFYRKLAKIQSSAFNSNSSQTELINNIPAIKTQPPKANYKKANLLTDNEQNFYQTVRLIAEKYNFTVLSKVRLADIAKVNPALDNAEWWSNFGKVKSKHIDFALAKKENLDVVLIIELDDYSHLRQDRIERDAFVDSVFEEIGIPIIHVYNATRLENKIISALDLSPIGNYNIQKTEKFNLNT